MWSLWCFQNSLNNNNIIIIIIIIIINQAFLSVVQTSSP